MSELSELDSAVNEFVTECDEILARVSNNLTLLEKGSTSPEMLDELYRDMHTMKGSAFLFGFKEIGMISHSIETCLDPMRRNQVRASDALLDAIFKCVDVIDGFVKAMKDGSDKENLVSRMNAVVTVLIDNACKQYGKGFSIGKDVLIMPENNIVPPADPVVQSKQESVENNSETFKKEVPQSESSMSSTSDNSTTDTSVRVQVGILDNLMNLIGEMVLVRNQVLQYTSNTENLEFLKLSQRLDIVTSDLQDQVMRTRMQPIGNVVSKFQRLIRDLAKDLGKQIDLTVQGKDTELDKTLLEAIKDPLTHIVRNSCDHGIENPDEREKARKPRTGHLLISAYHEGGQVIVEISDDGRGLNRKKILQKAIEKGLVPAEKSAALLDREILGLIFLPGFSTAEQVSSVSGRGVGMDVVRTNIEKIGGSVDIESLEGKGTTIRLRIPLTLAIVPAMLVKSDGATYAVPQVKLVELVCVESGDHVENQEKIQFLQGKPVYELRGKILPLVDLRQVLNKGKSDEDFHVRWKQSSINIAVLSTDGDLFGLIVDEVLDTADIVVKPLTKFLKSLDAYSAATILGSGEVALIVDPSGIARIAKLTLAQRKQEGAFGDQSGMNRTKAKDAQEYLLLKTNAPGKYALPLCMVNRLEELDKSKIEYSGEQPIVQYRDSILPLLDTNKVLGFDGENYTGLQQLPTIVVQRSGKLFGMIVNAILDVTSVDEPIDDSIKDRFGVLGNLIIGSEVVTVIDVLGLIEKETGTTFEKTNVGQVEPDVAKKRPKVLYAEDVAFFRRQVSKLLTSNGFDVTTAPDGKAALDLLTAADASEFSLILSDIEMPEMNGYQLVRNIRGMQKFENVPIVALTTRFNQRDIDEGMKAGFDCYLEKLNPEVLMKNIETLLLKEDDRKTA